MEARENMSSFGEVPNESDSKTEAVIPVPEAESSSRITEETTNDKQWQKQNLLLQIPTITMEVASTEFVQIKMSPTPTPKKVNFLLTPSSSEARPVPSPGPTLTRGKSSMKRLLSRSLKNWNLHPTSSIEKAGPSDNVVQGDSSNVMIPQEKSSSISRSWSLTKIFTPRMNRTSSLPVTAIAHSTSDASAAHGSVNTDTKGARGQIFRSLSVPDFHKDRSMRRVDSFFRVIPSTPKAKTNVDHEKMVTSSNGDAENEADGEDIPEEEAACRICFVELCESGETLKMECSCKGELALAHRECAIKWFSIKGNKNCDVCKREVQNLPVTLLRVQSVVNRNMNRISNGEFDGYSEVYRIWQELSVLVIVSMLAYFCFLEQLLVRNMGTGAVALSLPFSCVLGLLSSITSSTMAKIRYVWVYASIQFALVVLFAHIFYSLVGVQAILSILLATFVGFGVSMGISSILVESLRWRRRSLALTNQNQRASHDVENPETIIAVT